MLKNKQRMKETMPSDGGGTAFQGERWEIGGPLAAKAAAAELARDSFSLCCLDAPCRRPALYGG